MQAALANNSSAFSAISTEPKERLMKRVIVKKLQGASHDCNDPIVAMWEEMEKKRKESEALDWKADDALKAACKKMGIDSNDLYEPFVVCTFPDYSDLKNCGVATEKPISAYDEEDVKRAICAARARASYYGNAEKQYAEELGKKWMAQFKEAKARVDDIKDKSGFTALDKKASVAYRKSRILHDKIMNTKAKSIEGILIQVREMRKIEIVGGTSGGFTHMCEKIDLIVEGIEGLDKLQSKAV